MYGLASAVLFGVSTPYVKLGKRIAATIRQLGYPTKNALKSWHREYEHRLDLATGHVRLPKYSQAQKQLAAGHYLEHGRCISATIKALGQSRGTRIHETQARLPAMPEPLSTSVAACASPRSPRKPGALQA